MNYPRFLCCAGVVGMLLTAPRGLTQQPASVVVHSAPVPHLVSYSGILKDANGKPVTRIMGVTFLLYRDSEGGAPLWMETQNVAPDASGHYTAQLGATRREGLPPETFIGGEARWLGVQVAGTPEQARVLLVAVPYAMKAADAETIGGLPPSAFVLAGSNGVRPAALEIADAGSSLAPVNPAVTGVGAMGSIPLWDSASDITNSAIVQTGTGSSARIGINTAPSTTLDVKGTSNFRGSATMPSAGLATASGGKASYPFVFATSVFNNGTKASVLENFRWQAEPLGNNSDAPSGTLNLLFSSGTATPAETGLSIASNGRISFAPGQTFPGGSGTVTSVGLSAPSSDFTVSGSPVTTSGNLGLAWKVAPTSAASANAIVKRDGSGGFSAGAVSATALTASTLGLGTTAPTERLDLGNDGNVAISTFPSSDGTADTVAYSLSGRGAGGTINKWSIYTAPVGGGFGVPANSLSIWQYPPNQSPGCCLERFTISPSTPGQAVYPVTIDGSGVIHGAIFADTPRNSNAIFAENNSGNYTLSLRNDFPDGGGIFLGFSINGSCIIDGKADLMCTGSKSAVVPVDAGARKVALYAVESPQNWFEDFGSGRLSGGEVTLELEPTFSQTVNTTNGYHVFLTPRGECEGLYVSGVNGRSFTVRELHHGVSNVEFDYRIVAPRKGYENIRLADKTSVMNAKPQGLRGGH